MLVNLSHASGFGGEEGDGETEGYREGCWADKSDATAGELRMWLVVRSDRCKAVGCRGNPQFRLRLVPIYCLGQECH